MADKHMKRFSISLIISEIEIKTTVRYHLTPVKMPKINNSGNNRCWQRCRERVTLLHCWWGMQTGAAALEIVWRFLKKLKIELPNNATIPLLGIYPKDTKMMI